ncbi:MAG: glycosyltransferase [Brevinematia bacterium]
MLKGVLIITHDMQYKMNPERVEWFCLLKLLKNEGLKVFVIAPYGTTNFDEKKWQDFKKSVEKESDGFYFFPKKKSIFKFINPFIPYFASKNKPDLFEKEDIFQFIEKIKSEFNLIIQDHVYSFEITKEVLKFYPDILTVLRTVNVEADFFLYHSKKYSPFDYKKYIGIYDGIRMKFYEPKVIKLMDMVLFLSTKDLEKIQKKIKNIPFYFFPYIYSTDKKIFELSESDMATFNKLKKEFANRKVILFINNFSDGYSLKETKWFIKKVLPLVKKEESDVVFLCCGFNAEKYLKNNPEERIFIYSNLPSVKPFIKLADTIVILTENKIGVKSKFIEALYFRKKVISTLAGVYGSGLENVAFCSDNKNEFSKLVIASLRNQLDFSKLYDEFEKKYNIEANIKKLINVIQTNFKARLE